jgi:CMP/dCMP kinase
MIIAVDGPAAAGKGTLARKLAAHLGYHFLDTGSLYRMVAKSVIDKGLMPDNGEAAAQTARTLNPSAFRDEDLRNEYVGSAASVIAVNKDVRAALLDLQRNFARRSPGAVLDGRDIGTAVYPDADVKLFVTASADIRAKRRLKELTARGGEANFDEVLADIKTRDERDRTRASAPLVPAADAVVIDTTAMSVDEAFAAAMKIVDAKS